MDRFRPILFLLLFALALPCIPARAESDELETSDEVTEESRADSDLPSTSRRRIRRKRRAPKTRVPRRVKRTRRSPADSEEQLPFRLESDSEERARRRRQLEADEERPPRRRRGEAGIDRVRPRATSDDEAVDLSALDEKPAGQSEGYERIQAREGGGGKVKLFFDIVLNYRPGINPLSFDNYHTAFLIDYVPKPEIQFSVGIAPPVLVPRFYELDYQLGRVVQLRVGRIWIPFDQINPHNTFGGIWNTSTLRQDNQEAFLPDIWSDLGIGFRFTLLDKPGIQMFAHLYVVNGFQSGGIDPLGESGSYPDFEDAPNDADNNTDKAVGGRLEFKLGGIFDFGVSAYSGAYSDEGDPSARIFMLGTDAQLRPTPTTTLRAGYALMNVDLPTAVTRQSYLRGGLYGELSQRFARSWQITARGGLMQNDNGVSDLNDRTLVGGRLEWRLNPSLILTGEHHRDLKNVAGKVNYHYTALRLSILM